MQLQNFILRIKSNSDQAWRLMFASITALQKKFALVAKSQKSLKLLEIFIELFIMVSLALVGYSIDERIAFSIIGVSIGFLGSKQLERLKRIEKQREIAKLLANRLEYHLAFFEYLKKMLYSFQIEPFKRSAKAKSEIMRMDTAYLKNDAVFNSALNQTGIFEAEVIEYISCYCDGLTRLASTLTIFQENVEEMQHQDVYGNYITQTSLAQIYAAIALASLNKRALKDISKFKESESFLRTEYTNLAKYADSLQYQLVDERSSSEIRVVSNAMKSIAEFFQSHGCKI